LLFSRAATTGFVHVLEEGRVRLSSFDADGDETQLAILEAGEAFREPPHREVEPTGLCAEALADGSLLTIGFEDLLALAQEAPDVFATLVTALD
jgi:CRP-like cAMP-binding protein